MVALVAAVGVACGSFSGQDAQGNNATDGSAEAAAPVDAAPVDAGGNALDGSKAPGVDGGGDGSCTNGQPVFDDDLNTGLNWTASPSFGCVVPPNYNSAGVLIECSAAAESYNTLTTNTGLPPGAAVVRLAFTLQDVAQDGGAPLYAFAQLIDALGATANLTFTYDPATQMVVSSSNGTFYGSWSKIATGTPHVLEVSLPPSHDGGAALMGQQTLDGKSGNTIQMPIRMQGPLQIGTYLRADGGAKALYQHVDIWSCP